MEAPNNTYTTHLSSSRHNKYFTTPTPNTPDMTDVRIRYQSNTTTYTHEIPTMFTTHYSTQRHYGSHILRFFPHLVTLQNTICGNTRSCSTDGGHNDALNMLRLKFDNKYVIKFLIFVFPCIMERRVTRDKPTRCD